MDWNAPLDNYCERVAPGLWGEPLNAVSNAGFIIAAFALWWLMRRRSAPASLHTLAALLLLIGLGSLAFHTFANGWSVLLDVGFIALFIHFYVVCFLHWFWGLKWHWAWLGVPAYLVVGQLISLTLGRLVGGGGGQYLPALITMIAFAVALGLHRDPALRPYRKWFGLTAALFAVSLFLRTVDGPVCGQFVIGTHFLWHLCNAGVLFLVAYALLLRWREVNERRTLQ
ncbi:hypothetical protein N8J89_06420 [Crossiella sp. CA-258035]|uniref:hypothetical protein n=1 Tax=Crossiella sp. CA-258035 TaxID=2981138 RepID=UPI0024BD4F2A|nr:hypothetical protein [Crossiella sp. CA-258035]WHT20700.1 hypothetical protein N8J89_06420 [Crossiella sp. CA-258035]